MKPKYSQFNPTPYESHALVLGKIKDGSKVLDVGCATGYFAQELKKKKCWVWGIEQNKEAAKAAKKYCEDIFLADLDSLHPRGIHSATPGVSGTSLPFKKNFFDYILLLDVLEHLKEPLSVLKLIESHLKPHVGKIIISVPNIAHISVRLKLMAGKFDYEEKGIMDETHLRFFTQKTFLDLLKQAGLESAEMDYPADFGQIPAIGRILRRIPKTWQYHITHRFNTLLPVQFIAVCRKNA